MACDATVIDRRCCYKRAAPSLAPLSGSCIIICLGLLDTGSCTLQDCTFLGAGPGAFQPTVLRADVGSNVAMVRGCVLCYATLWCFVAWFGLAWVACLKLEWLTWHVDDGSIACSVAATVYKVQDDATDIQVPRGR